MPNTSGSYPMPYPNSSDVPDVPGDFLVLAQAVDVALTGGLGGLDSVEFTPAWSDLTVGNGSQSWRYQIVGGVVTVFGYFQLGSTSSVGSNPHFASPVAGVFVSGQRLGASMFDDTGSNRFHGSVHYDGGLGAPLARRFSVSGSQIVDSAITATTPFTWTTGDTISLNYSYLAA